MMRVLDWKHGYFELPAGAPTPARSSSTSASRTCLLEHARLRDEASRRVPSRSRRASAASASRRAATGAAARSARRARGRGRSWTAGTSTAVHGSADAAGPTIEDHVGLARAGPPRARSSDSARPPRRARCRRRRRASSSSSQLPGPAATRLPRPPASRSITASTRGSLRRLRGARAVERWPRSSATARAAASARPMRAPTVAQRALDVGQRVHRASTASRRRRRARARAASAWTSSTMTSVGRSRTIASRFGARKLPTFGSACDLGRELRVVVDADQLAGRAERGDDLGRRRRSA